MVQMGDSVAVERCVQHLNNIPVGTGGKIQIAFSKQNFLSEVINPFLLPDHTPSFKEFTGSKNNRFLSPAQASKNRIQPPSKVSTPNIFHMRPLYNIIFLLSLQILHFFNTPPGLTEDQLIGIFNIKEVPAVSVRLFPLKTERSSSGLIEFPNISQAVLAIMKCNHLPIEGKGEIVLCLSVIQKKKKRNAKRKSKRPDPIHTFCAYGQVYQMKKLHQIFATYPKK